MPTPDYPTIRAKAFEPRHFALSREDRERLAGMNDACRRHELGLLLYAHMWNEKARELHVAVLSHPAEMALQKRWQAERVARIDRADAEFFPVVEAEAWAAESYAPAMRSAA